MKARLLRWIVIPLVAISLLIVFMAMLFQVWIFDPTPKGLTITPQRTRLPEPIFYHYDGRPNFVETMNWNAQQGVEPSSNAAIDCLRALGPLTATSDHWDYLCHAMEFSRRLDEPTLEIAERQAYKHVDGKSELTWLPWRSEDFPQMAALLDRNHQVLQSLREASKKPQFYLPLCPSPSGAMSDILLTHEQGMREVIRLLYFEATRCAERGSFSEALDNAEAILRYAKHLESAPHIIVKSLVAVAHYGLGCKLLQVLAIQIQLQRPDDARSLLIRIKTLIEDYKRPIDLYTALDQGERFMVHDAIMRAAFYGVSPPPQDGTPLSINRDFLNSCDWTSLVDDGNELFDRLLEPLHSDDYQQVQRSKRELDVEKLLKQKYGGQISVGGMIRAKFSRHTRTKLMGKILLGLFLPALDQLVDVRFRSIANARLAYTTALLAEHALVHGDYPKQLRDLRLEGAQESDEWTLDPFTNAPFRYSAPQADARYSLYSIGPNGIDNQGRAFGDAGADDVVAIIPLLDGTLSDPDELK